jgi:hypothetical protein
MIGVVVAVVLLAAVVFVALRRLPLAPPPQLSPELAAAAQRMARTLRTVGVSMEEFSASTARASAALGAFGETWKEHLSGSARPR